MIKPEETDEKIEVFTFNTADAKGGSNVSHAERQFIEVFDSRIDASRVTDISIKLSHSPCSLCAQDDPTGNLALFLTRPRGAKSLGQMLKAKPTLHYDDVHNGRNATTTADIAVLLGAGWKVSGPPVTRKPRRKLVKGALPGGGSRRMARPRY